MGTGAYIKDGSIEVDTDAWLAATTGGAIPELSDELTDFECYLQQETSLRLNTVPIFITARCGRDWRNEEFALIQTSDGGGTVNLSEDMIIHRYTDPTHGPVALVTTNYHYSMGSTSAYADSARDSAEWFSYHDIDIYCAQGHGWHYASDELTDTNGTGHTVKELFPDDIVTTDDDSESATYGDYRIICPSCGQLCDVDLPGQ